MYIHICNNLFTIAICTTGSGTYDVNFYKVGSTKDHVKRTTVCIKLRLTPTSTSTLTFTSEGNKSKYYLTDIRHLTCNIDTVLSNGIPLVVTTMETK